MTAPAKLLNSMPVHNLLSCQDSGRKVVAVVLGTRPEAIKLAPVIAELGKCSGELEATVISSGQHQSLLAPFLAPMGVTIDHDLGVMTRDQNPSVVCARVMLGLDRIFTQNPPDLVIVQGDTTTALAGALWAFYLGIPVAHVEAGLRSFDMDSPFPEEMNRVLISRIATYHFAATAWNVKTLESEGIAPESIFVTGNPVVDSLKSHFDDEDPLPTLQSVLVRTSDLRRIVLTTHRRESFGSVLDENLTTIRDFVDKHQGVALVFPVHPNPAVTLAANRLLSGHDRIILMDPLPYGQFICLLKAAWLIVSDSGGVQEEAPTLGKPLLILRRNTERRESVDCGIAKLIGDEPGELDRLLREAYAKGSWTERVSSIPNPFGDGKSGARIASLISQLVGARLLEDACVGI